MEKVELAIQQQCCDKIYEKMKIKDDPHILAFEDMLNINAEERFGLENNENTEEA